MDGTQDDSFKEQISMVARYLTDTDEAVERTFAFCNAKCTSGKSLYDLLIEILAQIGLFPSNIIGCSFDGASNMRSFIKGVNGFLKQDNPACFYVWCLSHRFNLVIMAAIRHVECVNNILRTAEESAKIFRGSYLRMKVWIEVVQHIPNYNSLKKLKLIGSTRWSSNQDAIASIIKSETSLFVLIKALIVTCNLKALNAEFLSSVCSNLNAWLSHENVMTAFLLHKVFILTAPVTKSLQASGLNIMEGIDFIRIYHQQLEDAKGSLREYIEEAETFIGKTNILISDDNEIRALNSDCRIRIINHSTKQQIVHHIEQEFQNFIEKLQIEINENSCVLAVIL